MSAFIDLRTVDEDTIRATPRKGYRFTWSPDAPTPVAVTVLRVARDLSWADIRCVTPGSSWTKRQRLPLPESFKLVRS